MCTNLKMKWKLIYEQQICVLKIGTDVCVCVWERTWARAVRKLWNLSRNHAGYFHASYYLSNYRNNTRVCLRSRQLIRHTRDVVRSGGRRVIELCALYNSRNSLNSKPGSLDDGGNVFEKRDWTKNFFFVVVPKRNTFHINRLMIYPQIVLRFIFRNIIFLNGDS